MLPGRRTRTAVLFTLALCAMMQWRIPLTYKLGTVSAESHLRQVRDVDTAIDDSVPVAEGAQQQRSLITGQGDPNAFAKTNSTEPVPESGFVNPKVISMILEDKYHFIANMSPITADSLMGSTLNSMYDSEIVDMVNKSRYYTAKLFPDMDKGAKINAGHCLAEFAFPFMGNHQGIISMVCLNPPSKSTGDLNPVFLAKNLVKDTLPSNADVSHNKAFILSLGTPAIDQRSEGGCYYFNYQKVYNLLFNEIDSNVYRLLGSHRMIHMDDEATALKEQARMEFIKRFYDYVTHAECATDKELTESINYAIQESLNFKAEFAKNKIMACPSNVKVADFKESLLTKIELAALRSFDIYNKTNFGKLSESSDLTHELTKAECILEEIALNSDLSAEYKLSRGHYVRIEYFKAGLERGYIPGQLLYISIDVFGSVNVYLFTGTTPDPKNPNEYDDYLRSVKYHTQPYPSKIDHIINGEVIFPYNCDPSAQPPSYTCNPGYQMICKDQLKKKVKGSLELTQFADKIYDKIFLDTGLDNIIAGSIPGEYPKLVDEPDSQKPIVSSYSQIVYSRKSFLEDAILGINCHSHTGIEDLTYMLPAPYDHMYNVVYS